jgi:Ti-type conjugative transfer relaxase TraA
MALFRLAAQVLKRSDGRNAIRSAAYRSASELYDAVHRETFSYTRKRGVEHTEILAPENAPDWIADRARLWNAVERVERRGDAQLAREVLLALPKELSQDGQLELVRAFVRDEFVARGMVADIAIHRERDNNPHVHIMLSMRELGPEGFGRKDRDWNRRKLVKHWRQAWESYANRALALEGLSMRLDHRSLADRGLRLQPSPKRLAREEPGMLRLGSLRVHRDARRVARENGELIRQDPTEALRALTSNQSTFTRNELLELLQGQSRGAEQFKECLEAVLAHEELVRLGANHRGEERYTTRETLMLEEVLLEAGQELADRATHAVRATHVARVAKDYSLSTQQHAAYVHLTQQTGDLAIVEGHAGAGKSYLLHAVRAAYEAEGFTVVGAALAGKAADGLQQSSGITSRTLASLERAWEQGRDLLTDRHVLVIDEAGMIGTRQMARVLEHARKAGAKVVLVGDTRQLQAIEAGSPLRVLINEIGSAVLSEIRRQEQDWQKDATQAFAAERTVDALHAYARHGAVHEHATQDQARAQVLAAWQRDRHAHPDESQIILSYRRTDVRSLNEEARALRRAAGELGKDHQITVQTREGSREARTLAVGDRIYFTRNDRGLGVMNGSLGTLESIDGSVLTVRLDGGAQGGTQIQFDTEPNKHTTGLETYNHLDLGYAATVHKGQGVTVDRSYVLASRAFGASAMYVAMSRHRKDVELHWAHDEFRAPWAKPLREALSERTPVHTHDRPRRAVAAAIREWRHAPDERVLVAVDEAGARRLNATMRRISEREGRLGKDAWIRTATGSKAFAVGDRVRITEAIDRLGLQAGQLATLTAKTRSVFTVALDDGRTIEIDTRVHRGLDHGYATTVDQAPAIRGRDAVAVVTRAIEPEELDALRSFAETHPSQVAVHGMEVPPPTRENFFRAVARAEEKEHAQEVRAQLAEAEAFARIDDLRHHFESLPVSEQPEFLARVRRYAETESLSANELLGQQAEVRDAVATLDKAEAALQAALDYKQAFRSEARLTERIADIFTRETSKELDLAEQDVARARAHLETISADPERLRAAQVSAAAHNRRRGLAHELLRELDRLSHRKARETYLRDRLAKRSARTGQPIRLAEAGDFNRELTFVGEAGKRSDPLMICRDDSGALVAFDPRESRSDLSTLRPGARVRVSRDHRVAEIRPTQGRSIEP